MEECLICKEYFKVDSHIEQHLSECIPKFFNKELQVKFNRIRVGVLLLTGFDGKYLYGQMNGYDAVFDITDSDYNFYFKGTTKEMLAIFGEDS